MLKKAIRLSREAHLGQVDKAGVEYFKHLETVANSVGSEETKVVAYLHDILEDTCTTSKDLLSEFPREIVDAVEAMTKKENEDYEDYLKRVKSNALARQVKLADLTHNMELNRLKSRGEKDFARLEKYKKARLFLQQTEETGFVLDDHIDIEKFDIPDFLEDDLEDKKKV